MKVLVIGDVMLDINIYGNVNRISPEAPVPVFLESSNDLRLGGAANVAKNCKSLGMDVTIFGTTGSDDFGEEIKRLLLQSEISCLLKVDDDNHTTVKKRFWVDNHQVFRSDVDHAPQFSTDNYEVSLTGYDIIVLSDYGKGMSYIFPKIIANANRLNIPTIVDPKSNNLSHYAGCAWLKPNLNEWKNILLYEGIGFQDNTAAEKIRRKYEISNIMVTMGKDGCVIYSPGDTIVEPAFAKDVFDVTGAGDTVLAALALGLLEGENYDFIAAQCMEAAAVSVSQVGTYSVRKRDLKGYKKIADSKQKNKSICANDLQLLVEKLRGENKKIVFTNGCFDILHAGHIDYLAKCAKLGDYLIIGLNSDQSISDLKGRMRPINNLVDRVETLSFLEFVDTIVVFDEPTPLSLIEIISPDILVKGGDYEVENIVGYDIVKDYGGLVCTIPLRYKISTSDLLKIHEQS